MSRLVDSHYDLLGVSQTATRDEIIGAEKALVKLYEQRARADDPYANQLLARVNDASEVLRDDGRRAAYDRDLDAIARSYVDVAYPLPLGQFAKLAALTGWLAAGERPAAADPLERWASVHPLLDGDRR